MVRMATREERIPVKSAVYLAKVGDYDPEILDDALSAGLSEIAFPVSASLTTDSSLLLKPNLLAPSSPESAVCTQAEIVASTIRVLRSRGYGELSAGDGPALHSTLAAARACGILDLLGDLDVPLLPFSENVSAPYPGGRVLREIPLARPVVDSDAVISLARLKTHGLTRFSGVCKNLFGCVAGTIKASMHFRYHRRETFERMLADIVAYLRPPLSLLDGIISMEGRGPRAGKPRRTGFILLGPDPVAVDATACRLVGIEPERVLHLRYAAEAGAGVLEDSRIEVIGADPADLALRDFLTAPEPVAPTGPAPGTLVGLLRRLVLPVPRIDGRRCNTCGDCVEICPTSALESRSPAAPTADANRCIGCRCCEEVCPSDAIRVQRGLSGWRATI